MVEGYKQYKCIICGHITDPKLNYECETDEIYDYICDECKNAVMFAKEMMKMCQKQIPIYDNGRYICPNCNKTLISVAGPDDKGRLGLKFCINCGQAVKWE